MTHYEIIGLKQNASADEIKQRCRMMIAKVHPDRGEPGLKHLFPLVVEARDTLLDPSRRASYDQDVQGVDVKEQSSAASAVRALNGAVARPKLSLSEMVKRAAREGPPTFAVPSTAEQKPAQESGGGWGWALLGLTAAAAVVAASKNPYDKRTGCYRRSDGTFASGWFD